MDAPDHLGIKAKFLNDVVVNSAVSNLVRWAIITNSRALAVDSLPPDAKVLSDRRRRKITADFTDHDVSYLPTYVRSAEH